MSLMERWTDFTLFLSKEDVLRGEGADPVTARLRPALIEAAEKALQLGSPTLQPLAITREAGVSEIRHGRILLEGNAVLSGPQVIRHLGAAERIAAVVCTIGPGLEELSASRMDQDPVLALALDGLGNAAVETLAQQVCGRIGKRAQAESLETSTPLSPGHSDWPVEIGQPQIFSLLDVSQAGVRLTEGGMMIPKKTVSFVVAIGLQMARVEPCELCSLKERCRYRHA